MIELSTEDHIDFEAFHASLTQRLAAADYLSDQSAVIDSLTTDPRVLRVGALSGHPLVCCDRNSDGHSVVIKYHDVDQGLADLPWHTDCGNGGHDLLCPMMNLTEGSGRIRVDTN